MIEMGSGPPDPSCTIRSAKNENSGDNNAQFCRFRTDDSIQPVLQKNAQSQAEGNQGGKLKANVQRTVMHGSALS